MIDTYIEFGLSSIEYTGADLGSLIEIEFKFNSGIKKHLYYRINNGFSLPKNSNPPYLANSLYEVIDSNVFDNAVIGGNYNFPNLEIKVSFIDSYPNANNTNTVVFSSVGVGTNIFDYTSYNDTIHITNSAIGTAYIKLNFFFNCWVFPFPVTNSNKYSGPLNSFSDIVNCICDIENLLGSGNSELDRLQGFMDELEEMLINYDEGNSAGSGSLCDKANSISQMISNTVTDSYIGNNAREVLIRKAEDIFNNILAELRSLIWRHGGPELSCPFYNFAAPTQNGGLYIQAAGADNSSNNANPLSGYIDGIHLRWSFLDGRIPIGRLSNQKLNPFRPKEGYEIYSSTDDYVYVYKVKYDSSSAFKASVNSSNIGSPSITQHTLINQSQRPLIWFNFNNPTVFNNMSAGIGLFDYFKQYDDYIEIEFSKKCFAFEVEFTCTDNINLKVEVIGSDIKNGQELLIARNHENYLKNPSQAYVFRTVNENITKIRLKFVDNNNSITSKFNIIDLRYETYEDFKQNTPESTWNFVGNYACSINDETVLIDRLQEGVINSNWPKYKDDVTVKSNNYIEKWLGTASNDYNGFRNLVISYLKGRKSNFPNTDTPIDDQILLSGFDFTNLELLNILSSDYHNARMLGLGTIDQGVNSDTYIYIAKYKSKNSISRKNEEMYYLTLPTNVLDYRQPISPAIDVNFDIENDICSDEKNFDEYGYAKYEKLRIVNLVRDNFEYENGFEQFFPTPNELFDMGKSSFPTMFGILYNPPSAPIYNSITNSDDLFLDYRQGAEVRETIPVLNNGNKIFAHKQYEDGNYEYEIYSIDWFGRTSLNSGDPTSIATEFSFRGLLKPPASIHAHYVQQEDSPLFTTITEQLELLDRIELSPNDDNVWTRVTFNWNHIHKINYQSANKIEFYYRESEIIEVVAEIDSVEEIDEKTFYLIPKNYNILSTETTQETNIEFITNTNKELFINSYLTTENSRFKILDIEFPTSIPKFILKKELRTIVEKDSSFVKDAYTKNCNWVMPEAGERFVIHENWAAVDSNGNPKSWQKLEQSLDLLELDEDNHNTEILDGKTYFIGGALVTNASYDEVIDTSQEYGYKVFKISFNYNLPNHVDANTYWNKGVIRVLNNVDGLYFDYEIIGFNNNSGSLEIFIFDNYDYLSTLNSSTIQVNYHPGYKLYLKPETTTGKIFNKETILPSADNNVKQTYLALRSVFEDTSSSVYDYSELCVPIPVIAYQESVVQKPTLPIGGLFASKPDFYKKSSYTFDIEVGANNSPFPFSISVLRTTEEDILKNLYSETTITNIQEALEGDSKEYKNNILLAIVNAEIFDGNNLITIGSFTIPLPDNNVFPNPIPSDANEKKQIILSSLSTAFNPINYQPIVYTFVKDGQITRGTKPVISKVSGEPLSTGDVLFDPYPFCTKFTDSLTNKKYLRFTDYTLNGDTDDLYFYSSIEVGLRNQFSERSDVIGPISVPNTTPPEIPLIKAYGINEANPYLDEKASIWFEVNNYPVFANVSKIFLYRTDNLTKASFIPSMLLIGEFEITESIIDQFTDYDNEFIPINELFYYRVVAAKTIKTENGDETVFSNPSEVFSIKLFDNINPSSPTINSTCSGNTGGLTVNDIIFDFESVMYKGKYYLYKLLNSGNWQLIDQLSNDDNLESMQFELGNIELYDNDSNLIYHQYKIVSENCSGLLNLEDNIFNLTSYFVPSPSIIGPKIICLNQLKTFKTILSKSGNTLEWKKDSVSQSIYAEEIELSWDTVGSKTIELIETDINSGISISTNINLNAKVVPSPSINGSTDVWTDTELIYNTNANSGNYYLWDVDGADIVEGQGLNSITIKWGSSGNKLISVQESNGGCGDDNEFGVNVITKPNPEVTGAIVVCLGDPYIYDLTFNVSNNIQININGGSYTQLNPNQIEVIWQSAGMGEITFTETDTLGGVIFTLEVDVLTAPNPQINGNPNVSINTTETYSVQLNSGNTYLWTVDSNYVTILSGQGTESIEVDWLPAGSGNTTIIELEENNGACNPVVTQFTVTIN